MGDQCCVGSGDEGKQDEGEELFYSEISSYFNKVISGTFCSTNFSFQCKKPGFRS